MTTMFHEQQTAAHYMAAQDDRGELITAILAGVRAAGKDPDTLTPDD